jgi:hypothetical protein
MNRKMNRKIAGPVWVLKFMPALSHWPDRAKPFSRQDSLVLRYISDLPDFAGKSLDECHRVMAKANDKAIIIFDPEKNVWRGNPAWKNGMTRKKKLCKASPTPQLIHIKRRQQVLDDKLDRDALRERVSGIEDEPID